MEHGSAEVHLVGVPVVVFRDGRSVLTIGGHNVSETVWNVATAQQQFRPAEAVEIVIRRVSDGN